eukprot:CAMPEP_0198488696 /NCGR_PEP_ID=MMETSP1462-20131121/939_1 /TAXON_ID=1333877 /ORGANISM="Brandtodinium nutriculum, Strain RCC3387" /LENGTH=70 /DNA_ID=CAMNT_0044217169 /DNA_START=15 /DNA_END=224 /DNA_ORIENTATION=-
MEISLASLGSSQMRFLPHFFTSAASRFWSFADMAARAKGPRANSAQQGARRRPRRCLTERGWPGPGLEPK